jgi:hypothetical protein
MRSIFRKLVRILLKKRLPIDIRDNLREKMAIFEQIADAFNTLPPSTGINLLDKNIDIRIEP